MSTCNRFLYLPEAFLFIINGLETLLSATMIALIFSGFFYTFYWGYRDLNLLFTRQLLARKKESNLGVSKKIVTFWGYF